MRVNLGGVGVFVIHGYLNFTLLNKAFGLVNASLPLIPKFACGSLLDEQRFRFVFIYKTEIII
jgi:hypothetical protein